MKTNDSKDQLATPTASPSTDLLARVGAILKKMDPNLKPNDEGYKAAAVLLASVNVGPDQERIAKALGYPRSLVSRFSSNLRKCGVWRNGKVYADWDDPETGGCAFWLDVCVALGLLERSR
jgi:hypothetical protein